MSSPLPEDSDVSQEILLRELAVIFPGVGRWEVELFSNRRTGRIYKASSPEMESAVAIKTYSGELTRVEAPGQMFEALRFYHSRSAGAPLLTVPKPYGVSETLGGVMIEWINAPDMRSCLRSASFSAPRRGVHVEAAGSWLGWFHAQSEIQRENLDVAELQAELERLSGENEKLAPGFLGRDKQLAGLLARWKILAAGLGGIPVDHAVVHHDFTPSNLLMSPERVAGFDLLAKKRKAITYDVCRMLTYLAVGRLRFVSASDLREYGCARRDLEAFERGYGSGLAAVPREALRFLMFTEVLRRWLSVAWQNQKASRMNRRIQLFHLRRMALRISEGFI